MGHECIHCGHGLEVQGDKEVCVNPDCSFLQGEPEEIKVEEFIKSIGLTMECQYIGIKTEKDKGPEGKPVEHTMDEWSCTLSRDKQSMTIPFKQGLAHRKTTSRSIIKAFGYGHGLTSKQVKQYERESYKMKPEKWIAMSEPVAPELDNVLDCLRSDSECWENSRNFEDFCSELGYDTDSRKAESIYKACGEIAKELKFLLGSDNYKKLLEEVERL